MSTTISGSNGIVFPDATSMQTGQQACKAWVNFNGTSTVSIRAGYNVSSITDNAVGNYTVNLTTAMPDVDYVATGDGTIVGARTAGLAFNVNAADGALVAPTTSALRISAYNSDGSAATDFNYVYVAIFR